MDKNISYGIIIKNLRRKNKFSQTKLGQLVGVSKFAISSYELETAIPSIQTFIEICNVCNSKIKPRILTSVYNLVLF